MLPPTTRALVVALACERPAERGVPLSRYSLSELATEAAAALGTDAGPSRSSVWRWLMQAALRPWRFQNWIFPRDEHFLELAGPVLDLYACRWPCQPLWTDEYVLSADEKTSIQARRRLRSTRPPRPHQAAVPLGAPRVLDRRQRVITSCEVRKPSKKWRNGTRARSVAACAISAMSCASCTLADARSAQLVCRTAITSW